MKKYTDEGSDYIRAAIGKAIFELLKNCDYDSLKVIDIYQKASVGKTTFYRYFGSKDGKKDAMYFCLQEEFSDYRKGHPKLHNKDELFGGYILNQQGKLRLLDRNNCLDVFDRLILKEYGPQINETDDIYFKYIGAGLWMGLLRAVIKNDFCDTQEIIQQKIALGFMKLIAQQEKDSC